MSPECLAAMNFMLNHFITVGCQYKATRRDFLASHDKGVAEFLFNEMMERYHLASDIADYIQERNPTGVVYTGTPAPNHSQANIMLIQNLVNLEQATLNKLDEFLAQASQREAIETMLFLNHLKFKSQKEFDEVNGIYQVLNSMSMDPGSLKIYDNFLYEEYSQYDHNNPGCDY